RARPQSLRRLGSALLWRRDVFAPAGERLLEGGGEGLSLRRRQESADHQLAAVGGEHEPAGLLALLQHDAQPEGLEMPAPPLAALAHALDGERVLGEPDPFVHAGAAIARAEGE